MEPKQEKVSFFKELITFTFLTLIIVVPIRVFIAQPFVVSGSSMVPTFEDGQYLIVDQISYRFKSPKRGDVIIFKYPDDTSKFFIKRIIALPNETVEINNGSVIITTSNGEKIELEEPYIQLSRNEVFSSKKIQEEEYFVMGDNRLASLDSRAWGTLPREYIIGRAYIRLLPLNTLKVLPGNIN